ncbi:MAG: 2Fe-2S iron-sulfur cluster-binding protein [Actinomycetota bacterium]
MAAPGTFTHAGRPVPWRPGDSIAVAALRAGAEPSLGGCLCLAGDCGNCLIAVDGVGFRRACLEPARDAIRVEPQPADAAPPIPPPAPAPARHAEHRFRDVVVVGAGPAGRAAAAAAAGEGLDVELVAAPDEAVGVYAGPTVVVRRPQATARITADRVVVATGAAELQPVCPGDDLAGVLTARAALALRAADALPVDGLLVVGDDPEGAAAQLGAAHALGRLVRLEGTDGRVRAAVVATASGEERHPCAGAVLALGLAPRDGLLRQGAGLPVEGACDVLVDRPLPPAPTGGRLCRCMGVDTADVLEVIGRGFDTVELAKRAALVGTGTCQGAACLPHLRALLAERTGAVAAPFTARPLARTLTLGEAAAGVFHPAMRRTALHDEHLALGARMERLGAWWRPWRYGDGDGEYEAVRGAVSIGDVGTLGRLLVAGPDAERLLDHVYPVPIGTLGVDRLRYALLLNEAGYVIDDGVVCRDGAHRFLATFTSGGGLAAEAWLRDWADDLDCDVRILDQTDALGAVNVTGPGSAALLRGLGLDAPPAFMHQTHGRVAGVACRVIRLSFTGEASYELHHDAADSVDLWRALLAAGAVPHGIDALMTLRLEKGHILVGQDTDFDSTPRRLGMTWAQRLDAGDFVGRDALVHADAIPLDRRLVGLRFPGRAPLEGGVLEDPAGRHVGHLTSSRWSPALGCGVALGFVEAGVDAVACEGLSATCEAPPFYDPDGGRMRG